VTLGLIGAALIGYGTAWQTLLLGCAVALLILAGVWRVLGLHDAPRLEITIIRDEASAERERLDWPHVLVTNVGQRRARFAATALGCRVSARFDKGTRHRLRWDSEKRGGDTVWDLVGSPTATTARAPSHS
jgi:hypothetical protein